MTYELVIRQMPTYLHAVVTGANTRANVEGYLEELVGECRARSCRRILIEERLEGPRLKVMDVFQIASQGSMRFRGMFEAIAYVDVNAEGGSMQFAENVAANRGLPVRAFQTVAEAEAWLKRQELPR